MKERTRLTVFRNAKRAGITAEEVMRIVLRGCDENRQKSEHWASENVMNEIDALDHIEKVFGKRARARCEEIAKESRGVKTTT